MKKILLLATLFLVLGVNAARADIYGSSLVGWWRFDSFDISGTSITDRSGNGNTATAVNSPVYGVGKMGQAYTLSSASLQYFTVANSASSHPAQMTGSCWVKATNFTPAYSGIMVKVTAPTDAYSLYIKSNGKLAVYNVGASTGVNYDGTGTNTLVTGRWYHIGFTQSPSALIGYVNGKRDGSAGGVTLTASNINPMRIGSDANTAGREFSGQIDDCRIYSRALSASEMAQIYHSGLPEHINSF